MSKKKQIYKLSPNTDTRWGIPHMASCNQVIGKPALEPEPTNPSATIPWPVVGGEKKMVVRQTWVHKEYMFLENTSTPPLPFLSPVINVHPFVEKRMLWSLFIFCRFFVLQFILFCFSCDNGSRSGGRWTGWLELWCCWFSYCLGGECELSDLMWHFSWCLCLSRVGGSDLGVDLCIM